MSWQDLQRQVREDGACIVLGHNWCADNFTPPEKVKEEREPIGWRCLRCDLTIGEHK